MIGRQKRLKEVYEHLRQYYGIHTQTDFAEALKYSRVYISSAMNGTTVIREYSFSRSEKEAILNLYP